MEKTAFIYALVDPSGNIRYIGKADNPDKRFYYHLRDKIDNRKNRWIKSLIKQGLSPTLQVIDEVKMSEWHAAEAAYILFYKEQGCDLVNTDPGGYGPGSGKEHHNYGRHWSPEIRAKMSASKKGKPWSAKQREGCAHRPIRKGWNHSEQARAKMSLSKKGEKHNYFGKKRPPEIGAKISKALTGVKRKPLSADHRAKLAAKLKGKKRPAEVCAKISATKRLRLARGQLFLF